MQEEGKLTMVAKNKNIHKHDYLSDCLFSWLFKGAPSSRKEEKAKDKYHEPHGHGEKFFINWCTLIRLLILF